MPPTSTNLFEEGAHIVSFKIVREGMFDRDGLVKYMIDEPSQYPGSSGCRNIRDVESDLKAVRTCLSPRDALWLIDLADSKSLQITKAFNLSKPVRIPQLRRSWLLYSRSVF